MAEQFEMLQYIDIATENLFRVILRENQQQCTIEKLKNVSLVLPCKASAHKPSLEADEETGLSKFNLGVWSLLYQIQATTGDDKLAKSQR